MHRACAIAGCSKYMLYSKITHTVQVPWTDALMKPHTARRDPVKHGATHASRLRWFKSADRCTLQSHSTARSISRWTWNICHSLTAMVKLLKNVTRKLKAPKRKDKKSDKARNLHNVGQSSDHFSVSHVGLGTYFYTDYKTPTLPAHYRQWMWACCLNSLPCSHWHWRCFLCTKRLVRDWSKTLR